MNKDTLKVGDIVRWKGVNKNCEGRIIELHEEHCFVKTMKGYVPVNYKSINGTEINKTD